MTRKFFYENQKQKKFIKSVQQSSNLFMSKVIPFNVIKYRTLLCH